MKDMRTLHYYNLPFYKHTHNIPKLVSFTTTLMHLLLFYAPLKDLLPGKGGLLTVKYPGPLEICQSTILYVGLLGQWDKRLVDQASDVPSIISFS